MQLLGSVIYLTSSFFRFAVWGVLLSTLVSLLLCLYHNAREGKMQDGIFHKNGRKKSCKLHIDICAPYMVQWICWAVSTSEAACFVFLGGAAQGDLWIAVPQKVWYPNQKTFP